MQLYIYIGMYLVCVFVCKGMEEMIKTKKLYTRRRYCFSPLPVMRVCVSRKVHICVRHVIIYFFIPDRCHCHCSEDDAKPVLWFFFLFTSSQKKKNCFANRTLDDTVIIFTSCVIHS